MINRKSQLYKYSGLFIALIIFLVLMSSFETSGSIENDNSLDISKGQSYGRNYDDIPNPDGSGVMYIYSGTRNVYEDGKWKRVEKAKSLKNQDFEWSYLNDDPDYEIEIDDYNYTHIKKFKLKSNVGGVIPFKHHNITLFNYNYLEAEEIEFENIYVGNIFASNFSFGLTSDVIYLNESNTEVMEDTYFEASATGNNYGASTIVQVGTDSGTSQGRMQLKFNITQIPAGKIILNSTLWIYLNSAIINEAGIVDIFHVKNQTWYEGAQDNSAGIPNWNDQLCGTGFDNSVQCNLTAQDSVSNAGMSANNRYQWNVTEILAIDYNVGNDNFSMILKCQDEVGQGQANLIYPRTKEHATVSSRPFLRVEYEVSDTTAPYFDSHSNNQTYPYYNENINLSINVNDGSDIDFIWFSTNDSGTWTNYSFQPTATTSYFNYTNLQVKTTRDKRSFYAWFANDTVSLLNRSKNGTVPYYFFRVKESPPVINVVAINPSTAYFYDALDCGANITNDDGWAYTNFTWFWQDDGAGVWRLNATEPLINITSNAYGNTTIDINDTWLNKDDVWLCQIITYDNIGSNTLNSSSVTILEPTPTIEIIYPVNGTNYDDNITRLDYVYTSPNPDKCVYSLNYETNITIACGTNVTGITSIDATNIWKIFLNTTYGTLASSSVTFNIINWTENYQTFNSHTLESENETFILNVTLRSGAGLSDANLIYNGTSYPISDIETSGTSFVLTKSIDIPLNPTPFMNSNYSFYWNFIYSFGGSQTIENTTINYQNSSYINLQLCNATFTTEALNFTFRNELTGLEIYAHTNKTSIEAAFKYWLGSGGIYRNYSYANITSNGSQYQFCIHPYREILIADMDMDYEAVDYAPRTYLFRSAPLDNVTNLIDLNLIVIGDTTKFFFEVRKGMLPFAEATVTISKYDAGEDVYTTVSIRETDVDGEFIEYMELDKKYRFSFVKDGVSYGYIDKVASCTESPCEVTLQIEEAVTHLWQGYYDVFATRISYTLEYNDTAKLVTYSFNDLTGLAQNFRLKVTKLSYNQTGSNICDQTLYTTTGTMTCNMTGQTGDFTAIGYVSRSPEKIVDILNFIISTIKDALGITGVLVSLFIIITIGLIGVWNPTVGVILVCFAVFMMKLLGFVAFGYTSVILIFILGGILAYQMKK